MSNKIVDEFKDNSGDDSKDFIKKRNEMTSTCKLLKKTTIKNNVMKEAQELFWDKQSQTNQSIDFKIYSWII